MRKLRIGLAQINTTVGDFSGNMERMLRAVAEARAMGVDLITFPELAICGYPPEDLLFKPKFIDENQKYLNRLVEGSSGISIIAGFVYSRDDIYNAAAFIHDGKLAAVYKKYSCRTRCFR
jgi:NAD+ synthase (glutamine-hydrolysing)